MMHLVMGGTFDPIHNGHLRMAVELCEWLQAGQLHLMPCHQPPHRDAPGATPEQRLAMLHAAVEGEPELVVDDRELRRGATSYTADTLRQLRGELGETVPLVLVVGTDAFNGFDSWREWMKIPQLAHIIIVERPGYELSPESGAAQLLAERRAESVAQLHTVPAGRIMPVSLSLLAISATDIRRRLEQGRSVRYLVPDAVHSLICNESLYQQGF